jgi:hypothetical protein
MSINVQISRYKDEVSRRLVPPPVKDVACGVVEALKHHHLDPLISAPMQYG